MIGKVHRRDAVESVLKSNVSSIVDVQQGVIRHSDVDKKVIGILKLKQELKNLLSTENSKRRKVK